MNEKQPAGAPGGEEDFAQLFEQTFKEPTRFEAGQMVEAAIVKITGEWIFLDVGRKGEGYLERKELQDAEGRLTVKEGDKLRAYYMPSKDRELHFTTRIGSGPVGQSQLENAFSSGIPVEGTVAKEVKGGFEVRISGGARAFCPFSQMGLKGGENQAALVGKTLTFKVTECSSRNIIVSHKAILDVEKQARVEELKGSLKEGARLKATVTSVRKFGAFIDVGGLEGLIPVSEIAWARTENVEEALSVGQVVEVIAKRLDWENNRLSFSMRDALPDPWVGAAQKWPAGSYQHGTVTRLAPFGAFVALGEGVEGLIHISKLGGGRRIAHPREALKEGQRIEVRIESVDAENKKLSLSLGEFSRMEEQEEADVKAYLEQSSTASQGFGTLGDLLKGKSADQKEK
jgi:small subunit ribosomal protein S1